MNCWMPVFGCTELPSLLVPFVYSYRLIVTGKALLLEGLVVSKLFCYITIIPLFLTCFSGIFQNQLQNVFKQVFLHLQEEDTCIQITACLAVTHSASDLNVSSHAFVAHPVLFTACPCAL